jgi:2-succinyl-6-hydroxy-2,4-cyclohexadiene-1-carboxylate synthase
MPLYGEPGTRIGYELYPGPAGAPAIVLLHGFAASSAIFGSNLADLVRSFNVVTVDLLGHGESDAPEETEPYEPDAAVARVIGLMNYLGLDQVMLCGHALGGALALRIALDFPHRVAGLVIINSSSASGTPRWRAETQPRLETIAARIRTEGIWFIRESGLFPARSRRIPQEDRERLTYDFDRSASAGFAGTVEGLVAKVNAWERLGELTVPTLVIAGERDRDFMHGAPRMVAQMRQNRVQLVTFEDAGHAANLEEPELFNEAVVGFAQEIGYLRGAPLARRGRFALILAIGSIIVIALAGGAAALILFTGGDDDRPTFTPLTQIATATPGDATPAGADSPTPEGSETSTPGEDGTPGTTPDGGSPTPGATATPPASTPTPNPPTPAPTATPVPATAVGTPTPVPPTATPGPPTATPTPTNTPTPTAPQARVVVTQPAGRPLDFEASVEVTGGEAESVSWSVTGPGSASYFLTGTSTSGRVSGPGTYTVTATVTFEGGETGTASATFTAG